MGTTAEEEKMQRAIDGATLEQRRALGDRKRRMETEEGLSALTEA